MMDFAAWEATVPAIIKQGPLWSFDAYRLALYLHELAWDDCEALLRDPRGQSVAQQLIRSVAAISAAIEEGYGRGFGRDYAYKLRIAIGEARESQGSYLRARRIIAPEILEQRLQLLDKVISKLVPVERQQRLRGQ